MENELNSRKAAMTVYPDLSGQKEKIKNKN